MDSFSYMIFTLFGKVCVYFGLYLLPPLFIQLAAACHCIAHLRCFFLS
jgi:hypothetical protein